MEICFKPRGFKKTWGLLTIKKTWYLKWCMERYTTTLKSGIRRQRLREAVTISRQVSALCNIYKKKIDVALKVSFSLFFCTHQLHSKCPQECVSGNFVDEYCFARRHFHDPCVHVQLCQSR